MKQITFEVPNISCNHCVNTIVMELGEIAGVQSVSASSETKKVDVEYGEPASEEQLVGALAAINYPAVR